MRDEPAFVREFENVGGVVRLAAELARQRPFRAGAVAMDAADHARAGRGARDLLDFRLAVDGEHGDTELEGGRDLALFLDGVAIGDAVRRRARREHGLRLGDRGDVEGRAHLGENLQDLGRGIGLHGIEHARVRKRLRERGVVLAHDIEIEDEARPVVHAVLQKLANALGHRSVSPAFVRGPPRHWTKSGMRQSARNRSMKLPWSG